jgi:hypothetical protein
VSQLLKGLTGGGDEGPMDYNLVKNFLDSFQSQGGVPRQREPEPTREVARRPCEPSLGLETVKEVLDEVLRL